MSTIGGKKREQQNFDSPIRKIGLAEMKVIAINPDEEEYKEVLKMELKEGSKATEYLGESQDGNKTLRVDFWMEEVKSKDKFKVTFFLENKMRWNKDNTKQQYINNLGSCSWAEDENELQDWFKKREYRAAYIGEEDLYNFLRTWLGNLDYKDAETTLQIEWAKLMKGNVKDLKAQIDGEYATSFLALLTIKTVEKEGETKEYQSVYNRAFLPAYLLKQFRLIDYNNSDVQRSLKSKLSKELKPAERFVVNVTGEYGCKDFYTFKDAKEYNASENLVASNDTISEDDSDY
jgi:hypothetical protein